ncbi:transcriptional repressor [Kribbella sp. NBC_01245]|uniref:Fur family transcriptional regulator n=1 Tax=Kribbella sp. NBC_01245 TaxID=2903578 RepID=UPI002E2B0029|nr:Fur family transcriptional regulator [Kribbella sp. NBC_01245]
MATPAKTARTAPKTAPKTATKTGAKTAAKTGAKALRDTVEVTAARLRERGERVTPARLAVVEVLAATDEHLSAEQIGERAEGLRPGIHRATVYRALEALGEFGLVTHVHLGRAGTTYHLSGDLVPRHIHLRCSECGTVLDAPGNTLDPVRRKLQRDLGFRLAPEQVALLGTCAACAEA